jgi:hypothetical protein
MPAELLYVDVCEAERALYRHSMNGVATSRDDLAWYVSRHQLIKGPQGEALANPAAQSSLPLQIACADPKSPHRSLQHHSGRFCDCRYGFTNCGAIDRTVCPKVSNTRAHWCAPWVDSRPMVQIGRFAKKSISCPRRNRLRRTPDLSHQRRALGRRSLPYQAQ